MLIREMSRKECEELLGRLGFGRLACSRDNHPYVVPIYFASEFGRLYSFSTMGQKIEWMRLNPHVCVEADEILSHTEWASVIVQGRYEEFPDTPEYAGLRKEAQSKLERIRSLCGKLDSPPLRLADVSIATLPCFIAFILRKSAVVVARRILLSTDSPQIPRVVFIMQGMSNGNSPVE